MPPLATHGNFHAETEKLFLSPIAQHFPFPGAGIFLKVLFSEKNFPGIFPAETDPVYILVLFKGSA
jgi:hypothetical protein